jgi:hypothetical protein
MKRLLDEFFVPSAVVANFIIVSLALVHKVLHHFRHPVHLPAKLVQLSQILNLSFVDLETFGLRLIDILLTFATEKVRTIQLFLTLQMLCNR